MEPPSKKYLRLRTYEDYHQAYLELVDHPHRPVRCVHRTVRIHDLIDGYDGPTLAIDFDEHNRAIGIEILYAYEDDEP